MARIGFALLAAFQRGATFRQLSDRLNLPVDWVEERIEAARLCLSGNRAAGGNDDNRA